MNDAGQEASQVMTCCVPGEASYRRMCVCFPSQVTPRLAQVRKKYAHLHHWRP